MINKIKKKMLGCTILALVFALTSFSLISAVEWQYGSTHQHTGYSTVYGYDHNPITFGDNCQPRALEGHLGGREK